MLPRSSQTKKLGGESPFAFDSRIVLKLLKLPRFVAIGRREGGEEITLSNVNNAQ